MLKTYIINRQPQRTGEHEIHDLRSCAYLPNIENQLILGEFNNCFEAIIIARQKYPGYQIDGCQHCSPDCHTR